MTAAHPSLTRASCTDLVIAGALLVLAAAGWWWSARMAGQMSVPVSGDMSDGERMSGSTATSMSLTAFVVGWVAMTAAMMLSAVIPVVRRYARAARAGTVAPAPVFLAGYLLVWGRAGIPVWWAWQALREPIATGSRAAATAAGAALLVADAYQLTPAKASCLRGTAAPLWASSCSCGATCGPRPSPCVRAPRTACCAWAAAGGPRRGRHHAPGLDAGAHGADPRREGEQARRRRRPRRRRRADPGRCPAARRTGTDHGDHPGRARSGRRSSAATEIVARPSGGDARP